MNRVINLIGLINYIVKLKITYTEGIRGINYVDKGMNAKIRN